MSFFDDMNNWFYTNQASLFFNLLLILILVLVCLIITVVIIMALYKYKIKYFLIDKDPVTGKYVVGRLKKDKGRIYNKQGVETLHLLFSRKHVKPITFDHIHDREIWLIRLDRFTFMPIDKPQLDPETGEIAYNIVQGYDADVFLSWAKEHNFKRWTPESDVRRAFIILIVAIVAITLLIGFFIYLQYRLNIQVTTQLVENKNALQNIAEILANKAGLGAPAG